MAEAKLSAMVLAPGAASGGALVLDEPLSFWGGVDPDTGVVIDRRHPQAGAVVSGRVLVMPSGRGSSSSSSVLAEAIRLGSAPAAVVLLERDPILVVGALVARTLYGTVVPIVAVDPDGYATIRTGDGIDVKAGDERAVVVVARDDPGTLG
jgi:predicted aconitase with swiveling domain